MKYNKTPVTELKSDLFSRNKVSLFIKREDLNHQLISGNKWWKLKHNIEKAKDEAHHTVLTFGGAYSNHIYATAAAAHEVGLKSIGIIRGEETLPLNATLTFAMNQGMKLHYVDRAIYRTKNESKFIQRLNEQFGAFYLIPEGGTNELAIKGCEEWAQQLEREIEFDYLCLPVGTGGTLAGMVNKLKEKKIIGFSSLKGGTFLTDDIKKWINSKNNNWRIETKFHFGGYGKVNEELIRFLSKFEKDHNIPLDPIYTAKMIFGIYELIRQQTFQAGSKILALHTGGLQGRSAFNF